MGQTSKTKPLKLAFLVGRDDSSTRRSIAAVCALPDVEPAAILLDTGAVPFKRRLKNLRRNIRSNGLQYPLFRLVAAVRNATEAAVATAAVRPNEVRNVLRQAFPDNYYSLAELGIKYGIPVHPVGNLNSEYASRTLHELSVDLGIVLGTRILKPATFSVPRMGCINLHKGKVPEYRGMPPGFWELYDGVSSAGVTVHFIDEGLDTGDIVADSTVPILKADTPVSLRHKLDEEGVGVLISAVSAIRDGQAVRRPQPSLPVKPKTTPTRKEIATLQRRLPHWKQKSDLPAIARNLYQLFVYYSGLYALVRGYHQRSARSRGAIILYHRVNDYSRDVLTVDTETFAAQLLAISKRYHVGSTAEFVECIRNKKTLQPTTVAIHFDDCYRDIATCGAPILQAVGIPACAFINSGFLDTDRAFPHDEAKYPFRYPMLRSRDLESWANSGFEVGAHTVNHVDLGTCLNYVFEIEDCGRALQDLLGRPVELFSFPFGGVQNISDAARQAIAGAGYTALFSAHGGIIGDRTDPHDIPRMGASYESSPLYCLLQIEGLALSQIVAAIKNIRPIRKISPRLAFRKKGLSAAAGQ